MSDDTTKTPDTSHPIEKYSNDPEFVDELAYAYCAYIYYDLDFVQSLVHSGIGIRVATLQPRMNRDPAYERYLAVRALEKYTDNIVARRTIEWIAHWDFSPAVRDVAMGIIEGFHG